MTAVVGILNKQAIAIAADSAVTISDGNGRKIFNNANKVFALSKYHPVGVMIYNSASFMDIPWETIIKVYRKQLGDKSFPTLKEYQEDVISFLRSKQFFVEEETQKRFLKRFINECIDALAQEVANENLISPLTDESKKLFLDQMEKRIDSIKMKNEEICEDFTEYEYQNFLDDIGDLVSEVAQSYLTDFPPIQPSLLEKLKGMVFACLRSKEEFSSYTGLIFAGFGEEELYPQLLPVNISLSLGKMLRCYTDEKSCARITNDKTTGAIRPFAQTDVIETILSGIDPSLDKQYIQNFQKIFEKYNQEVARQIGNTNDVLRQKIQNLDLIPLLDELMQLNHDIRRKNFINPLMRAVSELSKEDLAEMAESLIYLTYLKRRITFDEESVGGPVDVALISKGDGFIWIKRKHYFKPELNQQYFNNYFKR